METSEYSFGSIENAVSLVLRNGSNHPRRINCITDGQVSINALWSLVKAKGNANFTSFAKSILRYVRRYLSARTFQRVTTSGVSKTLFVFIGDSHGEFASRVTISDRSSRAVSLWLGPLLGHTLGNTNKFEPVIYQTIEKLLEGGKYEKLCLLFIVGEIDIRTQSWIQIRFKNLYAGINVFCENLASSVANKALNVVDQLRSKYSYLEISGLIIKPTPPSAKGYYEPTTLEEYYNIRKSHEFPRFGSLRFRLDVYEKYVIHLRETLNQDQYKHSVFFCDIDNSVFGPDGSLAAVVSDDGCHITLASAIKKNFELIIKCISRGKDKRDRSVILRIFLFAFLMGRQVCVNFVIYSSL